MLSRKARALQEKMFSILHASLTVVVWFRAMKIMMIIPLTMKIAEFKTDRVMSLTLCKS